MSFKGMDVGRVGYEVAMAGTVFVDNRTDEMFVCLFPSMDELEVTDVLELSDDEWKQLIRQSDLMETEVLAKAKDGKIHKVIARKCERQINGRTSWSVFRRDGYRCRYCGNDKTPLTVDHLILWEDGGPSTEENLVAACKKCNKKRGNMKYEEWLQHPYYKKTSRNLSEAVRVDNESILARLDKVQRVFP